MSSTSLLLVGAIAACVCSSEVNVATDDLNLSKQVVPPAIKTKLWVWSPVVSNVTEQKIFMQWLSSQSVRSATVNPISITSLLVSGGSLTRGDEAAWQSFATMVAPVGVAPLFSWSGRSDVTVPTQQVMNFTNTVLNWYALSKSAGKVGPSGVSFDIEPTTPQQYQDWASAMQMIKNARDGAGIPREDFKISIAASWGYESANVTCGSSVDVDGETESETVSLAQCAARNVDQYILMNYRNNANGCVCKPAGVNPPKYECHPGSVIPGNCSMAAPISRDGMVGKAIETANIIKQENYAKLSLGVETSCGLAYQYKLSFCDTSVDYLATQMQDTLTWFTQSTNYTNVFDTDATCIEDYRALKTLQAY